MTSKFLFGLILLIGLVACGTPTEAPNLAMTAQDSLQMRGWVPDRLKGQIVLSPVTGAQAGSGTWWGSKISNAALQDAIEESLRATGMLAIRQGTGDFSMEVKLIELEQPKFGLNTKVAVTIEYKVVNMGSGATVYQRRLRSMYVAEFTSSLLNPNDRLRLASEGAVRSNVNLMLRDLIALALN